MVLPCIAEKRFEETCYPAHGYCNKHLEYYRPTQFSGTEVESQNWMLGMCALSCAPPRLGLLLDCHRFVQYGVRNCENT